MPTYCAAICLMPRKKVHDPHVAFRWLESLRYIALHDKTQLSPQRVTCHMGSQCYLPSDRDKRAPARLHPGGMEG